MEPAKMKTHHGYFLGKPMSAVGTELPVRLGLDLCHCCVRLIQLIKCTVAARRRTNE